MENTVIRLEDVGKTYQLGKLGGVTTIQESILNLVTGKDVRKRRWNVLFRHYSIFILI